jgi:hypothetical protein
MLSESARMASAQEARYRIDAPNSTPRTVKIIALDHASEPLVQQLASRSWNKATFFTASAFAEMPKPASERFSMQGWLSDLAGRAKDLVDEVNSADLIVMVTTAGEDAPAASLIGEACAGRHVMTTSLILGSTAKSDAELSKSLAQLRPYSQMLVVATAADYVEDMLRALRA